jgi:YidC/Oxa1 family membrane protein insertase
LLIAVGGFLLMTLLPQFMGSSSQVQPLTVEGTRAPAKRAPERLCDIWSDEFRAQLSSRSATLKRFQLLTAKYTKDGKPTELATTPDVEDRRQLRLNYRNPAAGVKDEDWLIQSDLLDFEIVSSTRTSCDFVYRDDRAEIRETIRSTGRPYELELTATVTNRASRPLKHAVTAHTDTWRYEHETVGHMFSVSPLVTHVECIAEDGTAERARVEDFEASDFENREDFPKNALSAGDWRQAPMKPALAAVSNAYFSHALVPLKGPASPVCQLQIEDRWDSRAFPEKSRDPNAGAMYRARLAYPAKELAPGQSDTFSLLTYVGPKERSVLSEAGGGGHRLLDLIDLGIFSAIAKVLVAFLLKVHSVIPNWGIAIIMLTITARLLLFPLALPSIKSMIKMRELKPEMDALTEKFKDDAQAKGLAQMELWRKHNVNPLKGCLPQLASMPVWFALYTTLQTAVELYNIPFLWFPDLSAPDPLFILPFVIGGTSFIQQKMMPLQGDPAQQKMMLYFMPAMFMVFMLFLPAGLGVYMFTNGVLGIVQQQAVEYHAKRALASSSGKGPGTGGKGSDIKVEVVGETKKKLNA